MAVVTVSRQPGSLGDLLARSLAEHLGYRLVERQELARLAAAQLGPAGWVRAAELEERTPTFWERLTSERQRSLSALRRVVTDLAERDNVVIVGLGAGQLLPPLRQVRRVLVIAPDDWRLERLMESGFEEAPGPLSREQARDLLRRRDQDAAGYVRYLFHFDWLDPRHWDLVINSARVPIAEAVRLLAAPIELGLLEPSAEDRQRLADLALASRVEAALLCEAPVGVRRLRVTAAGGTVRLEGEVTLDEEIAIVEETVRAIPGVRAVDNRLGVRPPVEPFGPY